MNPKGTKCYTFTNHLDLREDFFCLGCENTDNIGNSEWQPIIDCREEMNLAVTPPGIMCNYWNKNLSHYFIIEDVNSIYWRTSKFDPSNDNQLWKQDSQGRIINKANGKVLVWDQYGTRFEVLKVFFGFYHHFNHCF